MSYQLRERNLVILEEIQRNAVSVEANLLANRARLKIERRATIKEEPTSSSSCASLDTLVKTMEIMMERISLTEKDPLRENKGVPRIINPNFRKNQP